MKHLFYVHSHITFLVSKQYIFDNGLNPDDCLFFCVREYLPPVSYRTLFKNIIAYPTEVLPNKYTRLLENHNIIIGYRNIRILENKINSFFNKSPFIFYVPNTNLDCSSAIITMSQCKHFFIIEEGDTAYVSKNIIPTSFKGIHLFFYFFFRPLLYRFLAVKNWCFPYKHKKFHGTISMSSDAFYDAPGEKKVINIPFDKEELTVIPDAILSIDSSLLVFFTKDIAIELFTKLNIFFKKKGYTKVAYKFHPIFYSQNVIADYREIINNIFGELVYELPRESVIENILYTYPIDFYSDYSAIARYASFMGRKCWSYAKYLIPYNDMYSKKLEQATSILKYYIDISEQL